MKSFAAAVAFACFSAVVHPAFAGDEWLGRSPKFPGWVMKYAETETYFLYCESPKVCGKGSIVSFHFHDLPAPSKADIRAKQKEPRLPITCQRIGKYDSCEYPGAIDKKGRPTHWRPTPAPGFTADFFHDGFLSERLPAGSPYKMLITIVSSAESYQQARKNYALVRSSFVH